MIETIEKNSKIKDTHNIGKIEISNMTNLYFLKWFYQFKNVNKESIRCKKFSNFFIFKNNQNKIYRYMSVGCYQGFRVLVSKKQLIVQKLKYTDTIEEIDCTNSEYFDEPYKAIFKTCSLMQEDIKKSLSKKLKGIPFIGGCKNIRFEDELKEVAIYYLPEIVVYGSEDEICYFSVVDECNIEYKETIFHKKKDYTCKISYSPEKSTYMNKFSELLDAFKNNEIQKVVISKKCEITTNESIDIWNLAEYLLQVYFQQYFYMFQNNDDAVWIGVSPEVLVTCDENYLITKPLAATFAKGRTDAENDRILNKLINDEKEVMEHNVAVKLMLEDMKNMGMGQVILDKEREILETPYVFHLKSQLCIKKENHLNAFDFMSAIYPPATIWGTPRNKCGKYVYEVEEFDRDYFTGVFGIFDFDGFAEFSLVIRSAIIEENRASIFAGSGIVKLSNPENEWNETNIKMSPFIHYFCNVGEENKC